MSYAGRQELKLPLQRMLLSHSTGDVQVWVGIPGNTTIPKPARARSTSSMARKSEPPAMPALMQ